MKGKRLKPKDGETNSLIQPSPLTFNCPIQRHCPTPANLLPRIFYQPTFPNAAAPLGPAALWARAGLVVLCYDLILFHALTPCSPALGVSSWCNATPAFFCV